MFDLKTKKSRIYLYGLVISLGIFLKSFYSTDGLLGNKEFFDYSESDWLIAFIPLLVIVVSGVSVLVFTGMIMFQLLRHHRTIENYILNEKFADVDWESEFLVFDHNEFKRASCRADMSHSLWISVKEYDVKAKKWVVLEEGRHIPNADNLNVILMEDYGYDELKFYHD